MKLLPFTIANVFCKEEMCLQDAAVQNVGKCNDLDFNLMGSFYDYAIIVKKFSSTNV